MKLSKQTIYAIIFLLLLTTLACESADYAATFHLDYETTPSPLPLPMETSTMTILTPTGSPTALPSMQVCTGVERGTLRVRNEAGAGGKVLSLLNEGQSIYFDESFTEEITEDGATWIKITDPIGWVNKRLLCETK